MIIHVDIDLSQMVGLYRDPHGKKIFMKNKSTTTTSTETANKITANLKKRVSELERKLTEVRRLQHTEYHLLFSIHKYFLGANGKVMRHHWNFYLERMA